MLKKIIAKNKVVSNLNEQRNHATNPEPNFIGSSELILQMHRKIKLLASINQPLLILGPTGSGKEVVANLLHYRGDKKSEPFLDINCGAIPENLVESELFGHIKGAFTGAIGNKQGYFQTVGRGTLFLDEIGELSLPLQAKLLRILETRRFRPVGSTETLHFEGRVLTATHRKLELMVRDGTFREDLYYRLAIFIIEIPSLSQRKEDIPELIEFFANRQPKALRFAEDAITYLSEQPWPGNVRQLRNLIDQLGVLAETTFIDVDIVMEFIKPCVINHPNLQSLADTLIKINAEDKLAAIEMLMINRALEIAGGNKTSAAQMLGTSRKIIERRLKSKKISVESVLNELIECRRLVDASEFNNAIPLLKHCIATLANFSKLENIPRMQFDAFQLLGISLRATEGWLSIDACNSYEMAVKLGHNICEPTELASIQFGVWSSQLMNLELVKARKTAQDMLQRAQRAENSIILAEAHIAMANTQFWLGDCQEVLMYLEDESFDYKPNTGINIGSQGFDLISLALTFEGLAAFQIGEFKRSIQAMKALITCASNSNGHAFNKVILLQGAAWIACLFEDWPSVIELSKELESISHRENFPFYEGIGKFFIGCVLAHERDFLSAENAMIIGFETLMLGNGGKLFFSFQAIARGNLLLDMNLENKCLNLVSHALDVALLQRDRVYMAELLIVKGRALIALGDKTEGEQSLHSAMSTAQVMGSVAASLQATYYLAYLFAQTNRTKQSIQMLMEVIVDSESEVESPYLSKIKALLNILQNKNS